MPRSSADPIDLNIPEVGFYRVQRRSGAPWLPARIYRECCCTINGGEWQAPHAWEPTCDRFNPWQIRCEVDGHPESVVDWWVQLAKEPITEADYRFRVDDVAYKRANEPWLPESRPTERIDLRTTEPLF